MEQVAKEREKKSGKHGFDKKTHFQAMCTTQFLPKDEERKPIGIEGRERLLGERVAAFTIWVSHRYCRPVFHITAPPLIEW